MAANGMSARLASQRRWRRLATLKRRSIMQASMRRAAAGASSSTLTETAAPPRIGVRDLFDMARAAVSAWSRDYASSMGAALSYYTVFSIAPLLLIVISIAGLVYGD